MSIGGKRQEPNGPPGRGGYLAPTAPCEGELRAKGSRFLAALIPAAHEAEARARLGEIEKRFPDATHHCWAWRLGAPAAERASDAGEPPGTAGVPILRVLQAAEISDVLAVVVRWFGGTKLGKGGLARAYAGTVREALDRLRTERRLPTVDLEAECPYPKIGAVKRLVHPPEIEIHSEEFGETVRLVLRVAEWRLAEVEAALADLRIDFCSLSARAPIAYTH